MAKIATRKPKSTSDAAVQAKTGKPWPEWFAIMDKAGCGAMNHKEIVAYLVKAHDVGPWWQQMVTVAYERARGMRELHQKVGGFSISRSKTFGVPVAVAFKAWNDAKTRGRWLKETGLVVRKATANKSMRITWTDGKTSVLVGFYAKGDAKCQVALEHDKLADAKEAERMKAYWGEALERLGALLT